MILRKIKNIEKFSLNKIVIIILPTYFNEEKKQLKLEG